MLILLPIYLSIIAFLAIVALYRVRPRIGFSWLTAIVASFMIWGVVLAFYWIKPPQFLLTQWNIGTGTAVKVTFQLDQNSWPYAFALVSLLLAVVLTDASRLTYLTNPWVWAGSLVVTAAGLMAIFAGTPFALIMAWTIIDLIEAGVIIRTLNRSGMTSQVVLSLAAHIAGTWMAILALLLSRGSGQELSFTSFTPEAGIFLLTAAGLRLGVIPLHMPFTEEPRLRRGLGTVLRLASPASSLVILSRLPPTVVPPFWAPYFLIFTSLAALYGAARWLAEKNELAGRPYWIISLAGMAIGSAIRGHPLAALAFGTSMIFPGGLIFLFSSRQRLHLIPVLIGFWGLTGLPFTPAASGWQGLVVLPFTLLDITLIFSYSLLLMGYLRHSLEPRESLDAKERWVQVIYPIGLVVPIVSQWFTGIFGWKGSLTIGNWWASLGSVLICVFGVILIGRQSEMVVFRVETRLAWLVVLFRRIGKVAFFFLSLNWFYRLIGLLYIFTQQLVVFITQLLEGEGGVVWAFVLLALVLSLLAPGGGK